MTIQDAYDASAKAWVTGPEVVYEELADALVASVAVVGARVLDIGAGTGPASRAARRAGARLVVGADLAAAMLAAGRGWDGAVVCDAMHLPFAAGSFDLATAAFCLSHLPDPAAGMAETRRVAPSLVASAFVAGGTHPAKAEVDALAAEFGFVAPAWYELLKSGTGTNVDDPIGLSDLARQAGYREVAVTTQNVVTGIRSPDQLASWRLGMAHLAPFVRTLDPDRRAQLRAACERSLRGAPELVVPMTILIASN